MRNPLAGRSSPTIRGAATYKAFKPRPLFSDFSSWTIGARIAAIVLALALPLNAVIVTAVWHLAESNIKAQRASLLYTTRSMAAAAGAKLGEYITLGRALARSPALLLDNLEAFEAEARRAFADTQDAAVLVADLEGQQLINTAKRPGQQLPVRPPAAFAAQKRALETGAAVISGVRMGTITQAMIVSIEIPVFREGEPFRSLSVRVKAQSLFRLLDEQNLPANWSAAIIDAEGRYVARVPENERYSGEFAGEGWQKIMGGDGVFEIPSAKNEVLVAATARFPDSGWSAGIGVRKHVLLAEAWSTASWAIILGGGLSLLSLLFASAIARSITNPVAELRQKTGLMLAGGAPQMPGHGPPEIRDLWHSLSCSAAERLRSEQALRESEERFRGIFEHAGTGIAISDIEGRFHAANPAFCAMLGYTKEELLQLTAADIRHPSDAAGTFEQIKNLAWDSYSFVPYMGRCIGKGGRIVWVQKHIFVLGNSCGKPASVITLFNDFTERKQHEDRIGLLMREVNHRSKNMLTLVQAVARQTFTASQEDFVERFGKRVQALAASQDLLVKNTWSGVDLEDLVRSQLAHFQDLIGSQIQLAGPALFVSSSSAQTIGMAIHELATNAGKHGALSSSDGHIAISWGVEGETFSISWHEQIVEPIAAPSHQGFGSTVIRDMAEMSLNAQVSLEFSATGLVWQLQCQAEEVLDYPKNGRGLGS